MDNKECIKKILDLLAKENEEFDGNIYSFSKRSEKVNKYRPTYTLTGFNTIKQYNELYMNLYSNIVGAKKMTFRVFRDNTQDFLFDGIFDEEHLKAFVDNKTEYETTEIFKIYGLGLEKETINYGKYSFVRKDHIIEFVKKSSDPKDDETTRLYLSMLDKDSKTEQNFVYIVGKHKTIDNLYSIELMKKELPLIVNAIRFMAGIKAERSYVDAIPFLKYSKSNFQTVGDWITGGFELVWKDKPIMIDNDWFANKECGNDKVWNIFASENKTELEQRIFNSINWVGKAFGENDERISLLEIAFAFECLFQGNTKDIISPSIVALISESYAFVNGNSVEERIELEKEFKKFYSERSGLAHGGKTRISIDPFKPFIMISNTIRKLLLSKEFSDCKSLMELSEVIKNMKYSVNLNSKDESK